MMFHSTTQGVDEDYSATDLLIFASAGAGERHPDSVCLVQRSGQVNVSITLSSLVCFLVVVFVAGGGR